MRAGGYLKPLKATGAKRKRVQAVKEEEEAEIINVDLTVSEVIDIYGTRCAALSRPRTTCVFQKLPSTLNTAKGLDATLTKAGSVLSKSPGYRCTSSGSTAP